jgi:CubicO group peptidase (beta-lactamase class C family)
MRIIRWIACVSMLSAWLMWPHASTTAHTADLHDLDAFIARALQAYHVPGAAIAVVHDGQVVMAQGYGVRDVTQPGAVDEHTIFQLASVTKSLSGSAAASVVDEGKLDWDTHFSLLVRIRRLRSVHDALAYRTRFACDAYGLARVPGQSAR